MTKRQMIKKLSNATGISRKEASTTLHRLNFNYKQAYLLITFPKMFDKITNKINEIDFAKILDDLAKIIEETLNRVVDTIKAICEEGENKNDR